MNFSYNTWLGGVWDSLSKMILENYWSPENDDSTVILGTYVHQPMSFFRENIQGKVIIYQTEPLVDNHWWKIEHIVNNIRGADEVWDFDYQNVEILKNHGIDAKFKPPLYTESLRTVVNVPEPDIDVLFYGTLTAHRHKMIYSFLNESFIPSHHFGIANKLNVMTLFNFTGDKLNEYIGRSKIILNVSPYAGEKRQEQARLYHVLTNGKCVVSEKSPINYYEDMIVEFGNSQELSEKVIDLLIDDKWKNFSNQDFKSYSQSIRQKYNI